jgi:hypothetical protein
LCASNWGPSPQNPDVIVGFANGALEHILADKSIQEIGAVLDNVEVSALQCSKHKVLQFAITFTDWTVSYYRQSSACPSLVEVAAEGWSNQMHVFLNEFRSWWLIILLESSVVFDQRLHPNKG